MKLTKEDIQKYATEDEKKLLESTEGVSIELLDKAAETFVTSGWESISGTEAEQEISMNQDSLTYFGKSIHEMMQGQLNLFAKYIIGKL